MAVFTDTAIVLNRIDFSETSQILVFMSKEHGKVRAIGKGTKRSTKKRFAVGIDLLEVGYLSWSSKHERSETLATLTEWKQIRMFGGLREKLSRLYSAQYVAEITARMTEDWDPHPELYDALFASLLDIGNAEEPVDAVVQYQLALLNATGSLPRFDACQRCQRSNDLSHFSSFEGGMICRHCEAGQVEKREIGGETLRRLQGATSSTARIGPFSVLNYHISHQLGREPMLAQKVVPSSKQRLVE